MKNITKLQIDTVEETLKDALREKTCELEETKFNQDKAPYTKNVKALALAGKTLYNNIEKLRNSVSKNPKLSIDINDYDRLLKIEESLIEVKYTYGDKTYKIDTSKEEKAIKDYILGLKLGTALMSEMQLLLDMIAKIK